MIWKGGKRLDWRSKPAFFFPSVFLLKGSFAVSFFCSSGHHFWCACPLKLLLKFMCMEWMGWFNKNDPIVVIGAGLKLALSNSIFGYVDFNNRKDIILTNKTNKLSVGQSSRRSRTLFFPHVGIIGPIWVVKLYVNDRRFVELPPWQLSIVRFNSFIWSASTRLLWRNVWMSACMCLCVKRGYLHKKCAHW